MEISLAYCGLDCSGCPIYAATREPDRQKQQGMRIEIARLCKEQYQMDITPGDVADCDGCQAVNGRLFSGCIRCEIRKCAVGKKLKSCAYCRDYACENLRALFATDDNARIRLEEMRSVTE